MSKLSYKGVGIGMDVYELDDGGFTGNFTLIRKLSDCDEVTRYVLQSSFTTRQMAEDAVWDQARKLILR